MAKNSSVGYESYCSGVGALLEQLPNRFSRAGLDKVRRNFGKRDEDKATRGEPGVRDSQTGLLDDCISVDQNIHIQRAGSLELVSPAPMLLFYFKAGREQFIG